MNTVLSHKLTDSSYYITIVGVKDTKVTDINETLKSLDKLADGTSYQLFDAELVAGRNHLIQAAANAVYATENKLNISNNISVETLLYVACETQINKAITLLGVGDDTTKVAVVVISETENDPKAELLAKTFGVMDDTVLDFSPQKYEALKVLYNISEIMIDAVGKDKYEALLGLITEKGALIGLGR